MKIKTSSKLDERLQQLYNSGWICRLDWKTATSIPAYARFIFATDNKSSFEEGIAFNKIVRESQEQTIWKGSIPEVSFYYAGTLKEASKFLEDLIIKADSLLERI